MSLRLLKGLSRSMLASVTSHIYGVLSGPDQSQDDLLQFLGGTVDRQRQKKQKLSGLEMKSSGKVKSEPRPR